MKLTKQQKQWLLKNERMIRPFLEGRYEEFKEKTVLSEDDEKTKKYKFWAKECKLGLTYLDLVIKEKDKESFTGI